MEILAPAGNREALERAEAAGADAVYLGYSAFSARAGAGNFDREELEQAILFAHLHGIRVYVTVNTLVKDGELEDVLGVLRMLNDLGADGVLVQDAGVLKLARECCPGLTVHASTQMGIHNRTGVEFCRAQGMRRVVLARECSLEEIRKCTETGTEIEVFGHGAQCVGVSGMCLFSSMVGQRSGNRGRCAQPCRMEYTFRGQKGAWLSPRDVCTLNDLPALKDAGVAALKLEGRLKRPEYVSVVTDCYRRAADLPDGENPPEQDRKSLLQIFNRGGFMRGYAMGCSDAAVIYPLRADHDGVPLGQVESVGRSLASVRVTEDLHDGDGLQIRSGDRSYDLIYSGRDTAAGELATVRLRADIRSRAGDTVARLTDARQLEEAARMPGHRIDVRMSLDAYPGAELRLKVTDGISEVTVTGATVQPAVNRPTTAEELKRCLEKTGGTAFTVTDTAIRTENAFVPVGVLNALRREALERLEKARVESFGPKIGPTTDRMPPLPEATGEPLPDLVICRDAESAETVMAAGKVAAVFPEDWREEALRRTLEGMPRGAWLQLPPVCQEDTLQMIASLTREYASRLGGVVADSMGQLGMEWPVAVGAGEGIPVMNRLAAAFLTEKGCRFVTASAELTGAETRELVACGLPIRVPARGRARLMILHHCPARTYLGLRTGRENCAMCDTGDRNALRGETLTDRLGHVFPLERVRLPEGCLVYVMNTLPTDVLDRAGAFSALLRPDAGETEAVLQARAEGRRVGDDCTSGHWSRPVD